MWVSAFGCGNERKNRKLSQNCTRFTSLTLIIDQEFKNGGDNISVLQLLYWYYFSQLGQMERTN